MPEVLIIFYEKKHSERGGFFYLMMSDWIKSFLRNFHVGLAFPALLIFKMQEIS